MAARLAPCPYPAFDGRSMEAIAFDEGTVVVADARIDDRRTLALRLAQELRRDVSPLESDAQLLLHSWNAWGPALRTKVIGDYAFVVGDRKTGAAFAARSHPGWRTLYYSRVRRGVLFASTIDALARHPHVSSEPSDAAICSFLAFGDASHLDSGRTAVNAIRKVTSGGAVSIGAGGALEELPQIWLWEHYPAKPPSGNPHDTPDEFRELLVEATRDRLWSSNASILLSGGMDSPSVAWCARDVLENRSGGSFSAFTAFQRDSSIMLDEEICARTTAASLGIPCSLIDIHSRTALQPHTVLPDLAFHASGENLSEHLPMIAQAGPVCLNGAFGDSLRMRDTGAEAKALGVLHFLRRSLESWLYSGIWPHLGIFECFRKPENPSSDPNPPWLRPGKLAEHGFARKIASVPAGSRVDSQSRLGRFRELSSQADYALISVGDLSRHALESCDPYSDARVLAFVAALDGVPWRTHKFLARSAMRGRLPMDILRRPKASDSDPLALFFLSEESQWVDGFVRQSALEEWVDYGQLPTSRAWACDDQRTHLHARTLFLALWLNREQ